MRTAFSVQRSIFHIALVQHVQFMTKTRSTEAPNCDYATDDCTETDYQSLQHSPMPDRSTSINVGRRFPFLANFPLPNFQFKIEQNQIDF